MSPPARPDPAQIQRLVVYPYPLHCSRHFVFRVDDPAKARQFLGALLDRRWITDASLTEEDVLRPNRRCPLNIGFTYRGLERLELPTPYLRVFQEKANAFAEGASLRAARRLADTGASAAQWWEKPFKHDRAHVLLTLHANEEAELNDFTRTLRAIPENDGLYGWDEAIDAEHLTLDPKKRTVHFGLRDGISDPAIEGFHLQKGLPAGSRMPRPHEPGEFLLGYTNNNKFNPWLLINPSPLPNPWLLPLAPIEREFFWNGSFAAFRKMEQHEKEFRDFVTACAKTLPSEEYVRAKIVGRWDDGRLVKPGEEQPPAPSLGADLDDFDFSQDRDGEGCPFGSHIRRMNPRDDPVVPSRQRPLIRRGMPYGPAYDKAPEQRERGLLGLFFCASLEDQFEHLLAEWGDSNPMGPPNRGNSKDPFIGTYGGTGAVFDIPMPGEDLRQLDGFKSFVTTRGTLYAFFPGLAGLGVIARARKPAS